MNIPKIADKQPKQVKLEAGKDYAWCACGLSKNQPFCDGSHVATDLQPLMFKVEKSGDYYLCQCKQSGNKPYCDGTHQKL